LIIILSPENCRSGIAPPGVLQGYNPLWYFICDTEIYNVKMLDYSLMYPQAQYGSGFKLKDFENNRFTCI
jgi:hypothetical protein